MFLCLIFCVGDGGLFVPLAGFDFGKLNCRLFKGFCSPPCFNRNSMVDLSRLLKAMWRLILRSRKSQNLEINETFQ